jgi:hypothetical protein
MMRRWFRLPARRGPRVLDAQASRVEVEGVDYMAGAGTPARVALLSHWTRGTKVSRSVAELTRALTTNGYTVAIVSTAQGAGPLEWPGPPPSDVTILRRPNIGYDFGSWATALDRYPAVTGADEVLLINDSLAGPFRPMDHLFASFHDTGADVWGLCDTSQFTHHIQSFCLGFKHQVLQEQPLVPFWRDIRVEASRDDIIWRYEIGLSRLLQREAFSLDAAFRYRKVVGEGQNPAIHGWRRLLDLGFPFVKRELLRKPDVVCDGREVPREVMRRFGVDIDDWVSDRRDK